MVHKKYTYKDGKRFGPYYYETKRIGDKIFTTYLGTENPQIKIYPNRLSLKIFIPFFIVFALLALLLLPNYFTGNVAFDLKANYQVGEIIDGTLTFVLKEGELIPVDSKVLLTYGDLSKEILLSSLVSENSVSGIFYAEGVSFSESGEGYGLIGSKKMYPEISFSLNILEDDESDSTSDDVGNTEIQETSETEEISESNDDKDSESNTEDEIDSESSEGRDGSESVESESGITGAAISSNKINGVVSKDKDFVYFLSENETVELVEGSVNYNSNELDDSFVKMKTKKREVTVTTNYEIEIEGFGEEYLGGETKKIQIDLREFNFIADSNGEISVSLAYEDKEIVSASEEISVAQNESLIDEENNETEIKLIIDNSTFVNITNETILILSNVTNGTILSIVNASTFNVNVTQFSAVLGQPVRWEKKVAFDANSSVELHVEIPASAENITFSPINLTEYLELEGLTEAEYTALSGTSVSVNPAIVSNVSSQNGNSSVQATAVSSELGNTSLVQEEFSSENELSNVEEITISITGQIISGRVSADIDFSRETWLRRFFARISGMTGKVIDVTANVSLPVQAVNVSLSDKDFGVAVEYYTSAPVAEEFLEGTHKTLAISSPSDVHYENVLIYTNLSDDFKINDLTNVKIEWLENASQKLEVYFVNDTNGNGYYDYIEWIAPKLSNQTFNIIVIINAQHLNSTRNFISNIYNETRELDGVWSESIYAGNFVRVTFERNLTNVNDITIYPRAANGTNVSDISVEIYEFSKNETIARFDNLNENVYNKVFLTGLAENYSQDVFDLLILNGSLEFDHIIDPNVPPNFYSASPANNSFDSSTSMFLNITVNDTSTDLLAVNIYGAYDTSIISGEHVIYTPAQITPAPVELNVNWSVPLLRYNASMGMFLIYHFDNNSLYGENSTLINDFGPGNFDGKLASPTGQVGAGAIGGAYKGKETAGISAITDNALLNSPTITNNFATSFWINVTNLRYTTGFPNILSKQVDTNNRDYLIGLQNSTSSLFASFGNGTVAISEDFSPQMNFSSMLNRWYFVVMTYNNLSTNLTLYINGVVNHSVILNRNNTLMNTAGTLTFFGTNYNNSINGTGIDDIVLYNKSLIPEEVTRLYRMGEGRYYWQTNASDLGDNFNYSERYSFVMDRSSPSSITLNYPADTEQFNQGVAVSFNWTTVDSLASNLTCNLTIANFVNVSNIAVTNNTMANYSVAGLSVGSNQWNVSCWDNVNNLNSSSTNRVTINAIPNTPVVYLNSSTGNNRTTDNLTVTATLVDSEGNLMNLTLYWFNQSAIAIAKNYNNNYNNNSVVHFDLNHANTTKGENWSVGIIIFDGAVNSTMANTSRIMINNTPPSLTFQGPLNGNVTTDRTPSFFYILSDNDGDQTWATLNVSLVGGSTCTDINYDGQTKNFLTLRDTKTFSSLARNLNCFIDHGDWYNWSAQANDIESFSSWTELRNLSLQALLSMSLPNSSINFSNIGYLDWNDTSDNSPWPITIQNDGNAMINVSLEATNLWNTVFNPTIKYQFKVDNVTGVNENNSFSWIKSKSDRYYDIPPTDLLELCLADFNYSDARDWAEIDINVTVPNNEGAGARRSVISFIATLDE